MKRVGYFITGFLLSIATLALAGGLPSVPFFNSIGVGVVPSAVKGVVKVSSVADSAPLKVGFAAAGASNIGVVGFYDSTGTRVGFVGDASNGDNGITLECDGNPCNINFAPTGAGLIKANGQNIFPIARGVMALAGAGCSVTFGNISACVHGGTGLYSVTIPTMPGGLSPVCTATGSAGTPIAVNGGTSSTTFAVNTYTTGFVVADTTQNIEVICIPQT